jgi:hypothetical protein
MERIGILVLLGVTYFTVVALGATLHGILHSQNLALSVWVVASAILILASMIWNPRPAQPSLLASALAATVPMVEVFLGFVVVVNILELYGVAH